MPPEPLRLLIVDDHPIVLYGLRLLVGQHPRLVVVAEAGDADAARAAMERERADYAVVDLVMGGADGVALIEDLLAIHPASRILVYSSLDEIDVVRAVLGAGARGYLPKTEGLEDVGRALERMAAGETVVAPALAPRLRGAEAADERSDGTLSAREREVLDRIGRGQGLQAIARDLSLSVKTVGTYRERLKTKLGLDGLRTLERYAENRLLTARHASRGADHLTTMGETQ